MITRISIKNFKKLEDINFDCSDSVVLIGPNNSGKSSVLQALTLWELGQKKWSEKKSNDTKAATSSKQRTGVAINRKDLLNIPTPTGKLLWNKLKTQTPSQAKIRITITIEGTYLDKNWVSAMEFDFANTEVIFCRPVKENIEGKEHFVFDQLARSQKIAFLQPMSGLSDEEDKFVSGTIDERVGKGKTADVLRNICYQLIHPERDSKLTDFEKKYLPDSIKTGESRWHIVCDHIKKVFGIQLNEPEFNPANGKIVLTYKEDGITYDLSSGGRGFLQTLLLLAYLYSYPNSVLLLDEPDAHLEIVRQREIFLIINNVAKSLNSQVFIASHSEVVLNEAASSGNIIALINNNAIVLNDSKSVGQFKNSLNSIGWDKYYQAKLKKKILYLEGSQDNKMLEGFAEKLNHPVKDLLPEANISYLSSNKPNDAFNNFSAIKLVVKDLQGLALFDRLDREIDQNSPLRIVCWEKRELENYFATPSVLIKFASGSNYNLFSPKNEEIMQEAISKFIPEGYRENPLDKWWSDVKASEVILEPVLNYYYSKLGQKRELYGRNYADLIKFLSDAEISPEIKIKLDQLEIFLKL